MSHFFVVVIVPKDSPDIKGAVEVLMAPFDENKPSVEKPKWDWWRIGGRYDGRIVFEPRQSEDGFNFSSEYTQLIHNVAPVETLLAEGNFSCFVVVTPDGEWHELGKMGWWAVIEDEKDEDEWSKEVQGLLAMHLNHFAVGVDVHI